MKISEYLKNRELFSELPSHLENSVLSRYMLENKASLDLGYLAHSAHKEISPILEYGAFETVVDFLAVKYGKKWLSEFNILYEELNTIDIYKPYEVSKSGNDTEIVEGNHSIDKTINETHTDNETRDLTEINDGRQSSSGSNIDDSSRYGFNSQTPSPIDKDTVTATSSGTINNTQTDRGTVEHTITKGGLNQDVETISDSKQRTYSETLKGNIGNLTRDDISNVRLKMLHNNFINIMFADIDSVITIKYYGGF